MRFESSAALTASLLSSLVAAETQQYPFSGQINALWEQVTPYLPGYADPYVASSPSSTSPEKTVVSLTSQNWVSTLQPLHSAEGPAPHTVEHWMILVTGGNKTCFGKCANLDEVWIEASAVAVKDKRSPNLGLIDCENNLLLCATWGASPAEVWWIEPETSHIPEPARATPLANPATSAPQTKRDIFVTKLNTTTVTAPQILSLYRDGEYKQGKLLDTVFHPFDGWLVKYGLNVPVGYVIFATNMIPSWTFMLIVTFTMRMFL